MSHLAKKCQNDDFQKAISRRDRSKTTPIFFQETSNGLIHPQIKYHHHIVTPLSPKRKKQQKKNKCHTGQRHVKNPFAGEKTSKVYFMCKKYFKVWYLGHSTQDLHRNRIYKIFFQIEKSCFPCPECQKNVRNTFFRLFGKFHKKKSWPCHDRIADPSPPLRGGRGPFSDDSIVSSSLASIDELTFCSLMWSLKPEKWQNVF